jgi:carboxyl-terminal processing protease
MSLIDRPEQATGVPADASTSNLFSAAYGKIVTAIREHTPEAMVSVIVNDLPAAAADPKACPAPPEYQGLIDFAATHMYTPEKLGNLDVLKNKFNCLIKTKEDADRIAAEALSDIDHSIIVVPKDWKPEYDRMTKAGIGVSLRHDGDQPVVVDRVYATGPANKAGLRPGDAILSVDGKNISSLRGKSASDDPLIESVDRLRHAKNESLEGGIGATLERAANGPLVLREVDPNGPAAQAGLRSGQIVKAIDGKPVGGESFDEINKRIRGRDADTVSISVDGHTGPMEVRVIRAPEVYPQAVLSIERDGKKIDLSVNRGRVEIPTVTSRGPNQEIVPDGQKLPDRTAYIRVENLLNAGTGNDIRKQLNAPFEDKSKPLAPGDAPKALRDSIDAVVLDLRDNQGGTIDNAVLASALFVDKGKLFSITNRVESDPANPQYETSTYSLDSKHTIVTQGQHEDVSDRSDPIRPKKIIVLTNERTAGAAEMLAEALRVNAGATIVGTNTYGLGEVTTAYTTGANLLSVPIGRIFTPGGAWLGDGRSFNPGISPDIRVENAKAANFGSKDDEQLKTALGFIDQL